MRIGVIGAGYVGLITGVCLADHGHNVICIDIDPQKVDVVNKKMSPFYEKDLAVLLKRNEIKATTEYTQAISNAQIIFICVGTPTKKDNTQDLTYIQNACKQIGKNLQKNQTIVVKSSVAPGTTEKIIIPLLEKYSNKNEGDDFYVTVNPEFLQEGTAVDNFLNPDRIIIGCKNKKSKKTLETLYKDFTCPKLFTSLTAAEMIKYASNAFLSTKISFINEIGNICKKLHIDTYDVAEGMGYDKRIGRAFLNAGIGWGGSCFPKDVKALITKAKELGETSIILESVLQVNQEQPNKPLDLLKKHISDIKGKEIGILGASFKPGTDDIRESRSIPIIEELLKEQVTVKIYDPKAMDNLRNIFPTISYCSPDEVLNSDAVLILTDWEEFEHLNYKDKVVIDGRKIEKARKESKIYEGVCW
ncbi:MAG: UDP-glucose/GDP-mannose dehydrogenase family protein [Candidatus Thermoplasmatota archaeon]|nr:UDP-glucose/GDP-mannose dehydrogenase family protein [Candidatus Thermoplasmatota archaeon]